MKSKILLAACICCSLWAQAKNNYADYVSTLVGTDSNFELSTGNTYPATSGHHRQATWAMGGFIPTRPTAYVASSRPTSQVRG